MPPTGTSRALPVVGGERWDIAHHDRIERPDVDSQLECLCTDERVDRIALALEDLLDPLALLMRHHRGMLTRPDQRIVLVENMEIVVVFVLRKILKLALAAPGETTHAGRATGSASPACLAAEDAATGREHQLATVDLVSATAVG